MCLRRRGDVVFTREVLTAGWVLSLAWEAEESGSLRAGVQAMHLQQRLALLA